MIPFLEQLYSVVHGVRTLASVGAIIFLIFASFFVVIQIYKKRKMHQQLEDEQRSLLARGRVNRRKFKLRNLYVSDERKKLRLIGRIAGHVEIKRTNPTEKVYDIFTVKAGNDYKFFMVDKDRRSDLARDVTLYDWNYVYDNEDGIHKVHNGLIPKQEINITRVDTLKKLQPMVTTAINTNPIHRITMRERKLAKVPTHDNPSLFSQKNE